MIAHPPDILVQLTALGSCLVAGVFLAFSVVTIVSLARVPAPHGIPAMRALNRVLHNHAFFGVFAGTALGCGVLVAAALWHREAADAAMWLSGGLLYLVGTVAVTLTANQSRNAALAAVDPSGAEAAQLWPRYVGGWVAWNHVRCLTAFAAAGLLTLTLF